MLLYLLLPQDHLSTSKGADGCKFSSSLTLGLLFVRALLLLAALGSEQLFSLPFRCGV